MKKHEKDLEVTLEEIRVRIETYSGMTERTNISELLDLQDEISGFAFRLSEIVADCKESYLTSFFDQKIAVNSTQRALMSQMVNGKKPTLGESKANSELINKDIISQSMKNEALAYKAKMVLESTYKVIEGIRQRISFLKQEYERVHTSGD